MSLKEWWMRERDKGTWETILIIMLLLIMGSWTTALIAVAISLVRWSVGFCS